MRRVELWSVFRLSILGFLALYVITLGAFALLWWIASNTGTVHNLEKFLRDVGFKNFHFDGPQLMGGFAAVGAVLVLAGTLLATVTAAVFNVLSEMTGGVSVVVIEEGQVAAPPPVGTRLPTSAAEDIGGTHESAAGRSTAGREAPATSGGSVGSNGGEEDAAADSGTVRRARSVMGMAAGKVRQSIREAARGLAGDGLGTGGDAAADSDRVVDGRGGVKDSAAGSGDGAAAHGDGRGAATAKGAGSGDGAAAHGDGRGGAKAASAGSGDGAAAHGDGRGGAKAASADSGDDDPVEATSGAGAAARSRGGGKTND